MDCQSRCGAGSAKPNSEQIFAYLTSFNIDQPVERALLFATGEDTVWAWVNGEQVMTANAYPAYHHLPWQKFVRTDVTGQLAQGRNTIAFKCLHYIDKYGESKRKDAPPMMATLVAVLQGRNDSDEGERRDLEECGTSPHR